jgi:hypothetical protein
MNGWRGVDVSRKTQKTQNGLVKLKLVFCGKRRRFLVLRIEYPYNILRQIANLPQRIRKKTKLHTSTCRFLHFLLSIVCSFTEIRTRLFSGFRLPKGVGEVAVAL